MLVMPRRLTYPVPSADEVRRVRAAIGAKQATFAVLLEVSPRQVRHLERGEQRMGPQTARRFHELLLFPEVQAALNRGARCAEQAARAVQAVQDAAR